MTTTELSPRARADEAAVRAAARSRVTLLEITTPAESVRAAQLLQEVWRGPRLPVPVNIIRTVQHAGGYAFGAYDEAGALLGVSIGLLARNALHSHITGVAPFGQRRGLGFAIKQHQRSWALAQGYELITWTCDPLIRRNMAFNLHALGARVVGYLIDHYGPMDDSVNKGDESDRFEFHWDLLGTRALDAADQRLPFLDSELPAALTSGPTDLPVVHHVDEVERTIALPRDIEALRRGDRAAGHEWRRAVRAAVQPALEGGAHVTGLTRSGELVLELP